MRNRRRGYQSLVITGSDRRSRRMIEPRRRRQYHPFLIFSLWSLRCLGFFVVLVVIAYLVALAFNLALDWKGWFQAAYSISWRWFVCSFCLLVAYAVWESLRH
ncbi:hypothetical protein Pse7367_1429 [Thalassoporum mexicanum PCC 7367]|uniref:hypothetical protein n=1 Tax=Thalassoporum mexicanum TaxID=3457544 RepID=UPI00029FAF50|nr:hypothetical protein [Pseudanabaena sp. PCC 7367]AFY69720.1 hypothetical protein Pse7367_1429 [Pseudanabaena sp. PCC 7367]